MHRNYSFSLSNYSLDYIRAADDRLTTDLPQMDMSVYDRFTMVRPVGKAKILADMVHPLEERTPVRYMSHLQASPGERADYPAVVSADDSMIYFAPPVFKSYFESGNPLFRKMIAGVLKVLLPDPIIKSDAPTSSEITLLQNGNMLALHVTNYSPSRRGNHPEVVDEVRPLHNVNVSIHWLERPEKVFIFPGDEEVECTYENDIITFVIPRVDIHTGVCLYF